MTEHLVFPLNCHQKLDNWIFLSKHEVLETQVLQPGVVKNKKVVRGFRLVCLIWLVICEISEVVTFEWDMERYNYLTV